MVTIRDVAKRANVSITSASYALNGKGTISEATRKRVLQAAEELNYHPNAFARNLIKGKTHSIAVFISRFGGAFYEDILEGIHDAILKTDYELLVCPESRTTHKMLTQRQADGAIVFDSTIESVVLTRLAAKSFPIVVLDRVLDVDFIFPLLIDNQAGAREAFYHLYNQGARKICFISGAADSYDNSERKKTFVDEAEKNQMKVQCWDGNFTEASGYAAGKAILQSGDMPDAVFCANDQMAIGFIEAMKACHTRVPEDIAVVGFDDIQIAKYMQPSLTTIGASRFDWGSLAAMQLIDFLEQGKLFQATRIPAKLIQRDSSILKNKAVSPAD